MSVTRGGFFYGQVTQVTPRLLIVTDADPTHPVPARKQAGYTPTVGDRVQVLNVAPIPRVIDKVG